MGKGRDRDRVKIIVKIEESVMSDLGTFFSDYRTFGIQNCHLFTYTVKKKKKKKNVKYGHPICPPTTVKSTVNLL